VVDELGNEADTYWESDAVNDRDEWDQHVRHVEETEQDRLIERRSALIKRAIDPVATKRSGFDMSRSLFEEAAYLQNEIEKTRRQT
jgi:hypothetical protein